MALERKHVSEELIRAWKTSSSSQKLNVQVPPVRFIYELCWTVVRGDLPLNKFRIAWDSVDFAETIIKEDQSSLLADTIAHMGQELTLNGDLRIQLIELAKFLVDSGLVSVRLLQERCEAEFLWEAEMIKIKAPDLKSKEVRVNTRLLYQQTKFNLLREESEGYAKLGTLLVRRGQDGLIKQTVPVVISTIKSLIGHFDLDPNRVCDIVLECYELQPENSAFLELIPLFPKSHTSHILGFKFQYYQRPEVKESVPDGLYILAATLIKENFIDLESVLAHLLPADEDAFADYEAFSNRQLDEANKIGKINLAATGKDLMEEEKPGDVTIDLFAALDMEIDAVSERLHELSNNQKLGLLRGFLEINDWPHAYMMFERFASLNPVAYPQICDGIFRSIENALAPSYMLVRPSYLADFGGSVALETSSSSREITPKQNPEPPGFIGLSREFFQMLSCVGPYLYRDALLLQKVCRVLRGYLSWAISYASSQSTGTPHQNDWKDPKSYLKEAHLRIQEALGNCLLPSLQLLPANPAIGLEIWEVMSLLPYEARYRLYGEWEKEDEKYPMIVAARQTAKLDTRRILKRLAKENLKQLGRMVAKIAHANPMTVLRTIVHQIEAYKDMITPVVDAFKYLTQLEYDVLEYVVIERLGQGGRDRLKEDGLNLSDWLQSLAFFWGHLCKKYPSMELRGLFQYLVNKLKKDEGIELIVLQELIQQMANVEYTENVTEEQLEAMAGGENLRYHATSFGAIRNNKALLKSTNRLRDSLLSKDEPKLAVPLLMLIAQHRSKVVINADAPYIKMVSEQFDRCHGTLLQYVEFLTSAVTPAIAYAQLVPTLDEMLHKYHIEPEVCFLIYQPVMRLFKLASPAEHVENGKRSPHSKDSLGKENWPLNSSNDLVLDLGPIRKPLMWSELLSTVHSILPSKSWNSLSPELYTTFWGLSLQDLFVPRKRYEAEIAKQHATLKALEENSDNSHAAITKRKKDKVKIQEVLDRLSSELEQQEQNAKAVHHRLIKEKDSWLTSCPDLIKVNMEFLQRCIFPRCTVSMMDAIYCARFVHTLHSLGTPFFNTVNHIDVLICKTLQPMICSCTEYEAGRVGRFLCETLKMAYYWKSQEAIYEKECGNMPGFAVLYRDPNSARVTFSQYLRVHIKWSNRITKLLIQCLESSEYIEIRNALTVLTKISSVFPVIRKTGVNLERRVSKIKGDEREDLKVLAIGVAAALAARKSSWVTEEEFVMGIIDVKPTTSPAKFSGLASGPASSIPSEHAVQQGELADQGRMSTATNDAGSADQARTMQFKADAGHISTKAPATSKEHYVSLAQAAATAQTEASHPTSLNIKHTDDAQSIAADDNGPKAAQKPVQVENEVRSKRVNPNVTATTENARASKLEATAKDGSNISDRDAVNRIQESVRQRPSATTGMSTVVTNGAALNKNNIGDKKGLELSVNIRTSTDISPDVKNGGDREAEITEVPVRRASKSPLREDTGSTKSIEDMSKDKITRRSALVDEVDRTNKRRKSDGAEKAGELLDHRVGDRDRTLQDQRISERPRSVEHEKPTFDEKVMYDKSLDGRVERSRERVGERTDRDYRGERTIERQDRPRDDDRSRGRSMERFVRERSLERASGFDRPTDRSREERLKDERGRPRYMEQAAEQPHSDDRFPMQNLPPPPPLPPNIVPQFLTSNRREEEESRRTGRQPGRTSPRKDEKPEKKRSEEVSGNTMEDLRKKDEDIRDRKREDRELLTVKVDKDRERDRDKEKASLVKEEDSVAANSKRRRLKRDHISSEIPSNFGPSPPPPPPPPTVSVQQYDRERDRKSTIAMRSVYEEPGYDKGPSGRVHGKDVGKIPRRDHEQTYEREWDEEKRPRADMKRRHHR